MGEIEKLAECWDELDRACNRILTAQPFQMTAACERLEEGRLAMRAAVQSVISERPRP